jgi:hypothetical protein
MKFLITSLAMLGNAALAFAQAGLPTPKMSEEEMMKACDVAVEGRITTVKLAKRWMGDRPGIDSGYEYGNFECSFLVQINLKGKFESGQTVQYAVEAYMEGKWDNPSSRRFVYEGTQAAVSPGSKLRLYLKWNPDKKQYERVHFNSGFTVLWASDEKFPKKDGEIVKASIASEGPENPEKNLDPFEFINLIWHSGLPYKETRDRVDPASLPLLWAALKDPRQSSSWPKIAQLMGYMGEDAQTARFLLDYVRRAEDWKPLNDAVLFNRMVGKVKVLKWVGKIGDKDSVEVLRKALTEEGAKDLAKDWIDGPMPEWAKKANGRVVELIRGTAAIGLVYSQDAEGIRLVEKEYERVHEGRKKGEAVSEYYNQLIDAMAARDMIRDMGKQEFFKLLGSEKEVDAMSPYLRKYSWNWQQGAKEKTGK